MAVRITREQAKAMGLVLDESGIRPRREPLRQESMRDPSWLEVPEEEEARGTYAGCATHTLQSEVPCPRCEKPSRVFVQTMDGLKIGDPMCEECHLAGAPRRRRRRPRNMAR